MRIKKRIGISLIMLLIAYLFFTIGLMSVKATETVFWSFDCEQYDLENIYVNGDNVNVQYINGRGVNGYGCFKITFDEPIVNTDWVFINISNYHTGNYPTPTLPYLNFWTKSSNDTGLRYAMYYKWSDPNLKTTFEWRIDEDKLILWQDDYHVGSGSSYYYNVTIADSWNKIGFRPLCSSPSGIWYYYYYGMNSFSSGLIDNTFWEEGGIQYGFNITSSESATVYLDYIYLSDTYEYEPYTEEIEVSWGWVKYVLFLLVIIGIISFAVYIKYW